MDKLKITAFGGFSLSMGGVTLNDFSRKTRLLLEYLSVSGDGVKRDELIALLSGEGEVAGDLASALSSRVHRLNKSLKPLSPDIPVIISVRDVYRFNPMIECVFDFAEFERLYKDSLKTHRNREKLIANHTGLLAENFT